MPLADTLTVPDIAIVPAQVFPFGSVAVADEPPLGVNVQFETVPDPESVQVTCDPRVTDDGEQESELIFAGVVGSGSCATGQ